MSENNEQRYCVWSITEISYDGTPKTLPKFLNKGKTTIGRAMKSTIRSFSFMSSRYHCAITLEDNGNCYLTDLGSLNGTYMNFSKIDRVVFLKDQDLIGIGENTDVGSDAIFRITQKVLAKDHPIFYNENCVVPYIEPPKPRKPPSIIILDNELDFNNESTSTTNVRHEPLPSTSTGTCGKIALPYIETIEIDDSENEPAVLSYSKNANNTTKIKTEHKLSSVESESRCEKRNTQPEKSVHEKHTDCEIIDEISTHRVCSHIDDVSNGQSLENDHIYECNLEKVPLEILSDDESDDITYIEEDNESLQIKSVPSVSNLELSNKSSKPNCTDFNINHSATNDTTMIEERCEQLIIPISADVLDKRVSNVLLSALNNNENDLHLRGSIESNTDNIISTNSSKIISESPVLTSPIENIIQEQPTKELVHQKERNTDSVKFVEKPMSLYVPNINEDGTEKEISTGERNKESELFNVTPNVANKLSNVLGNEENKQTNSPLGGSEKRLPEVDETSQNICVRRPSTKSDSSETETNKFTDSKESNCKVSSISESFTVDDDDVIFLEDNNERPCQMFDIKPEMPMEDNNQAGEDYCIDDDISDTDSTDEWFQRLSQSCTEDLNMEEENLNIVGDEIKEISTNKKTSDDNEDMEVKQSGFIEDKYNETNAPESLENQNKDTLKQVSLSGKRKIFEVLEEDEDEEYISKESQEHYVEDDFSEPLLRKCPPGSKRKLPEFSDDEKEENNTMQKNIEDLNKQSKRKQKFVSINKVKLKKNKGDENNLEGVKGNIVGNKIMRSSSDESVVKQKYSKVEACRIEELSKSKASEQNNKKTDSENDIINKDDSLGTKLNDVKSSNYVERSVSSLTNKLMPIDIFSGKNIDSNKKKHHGTARKSTSKVRFLGKHNKNGNDMKRKVSTESDCALSSDFEQNNVLTNIDLQSKEQNDVSKSNWQDYRDMLLKKIDDMEEATNKGSCFSPDLPTDVIKSGEKKPLDNTENIIKVAENLNFSSKQIEINEPIKQSKTLSVVPALESEKEEIISTVTSNITENVVVDKSQKCVSSVPEDRLDVVCKKIESSHKKNIVEIIEAKALPVRRRSIASTEERGSLDKERASTSSDKWYSKDPVQKKSTKMSDADRKAIIKAKLSDITKKDSNVNIVEERPKSVSSAKNTTKVTSKSRNEIFLDTLVSNDTSSKASNVSADNGKEKSKLSTFKIPRRNSSIDVHEQSVPANANTSTTTQDFTLEPLTASVNVNATELGLVIPPNDVALEVLTDKLSNSIKNKFKTRVSRVSTAAVAGIENEEPVKIKPLPDIPPYEPNSNVCNSKGLLKKIGGGFIKDNKIKRRVHFNLPGDESNVIYLRKRDIEVSDFSTLKRVTKQVTKHERPPVKKEISRASYTDYADELILQICNWNTVWFQEKNKVKGEPNVFDGQIYHLKKEFSSYSDYRRGFYPLLLYQLWQILARQHDALGTKNKLFNFEIKQMTSNKVKIQFQNQDNSKVLTTMESQVLVERNNQVFLPRPGTVVVMHAKVIDSVEGQKNTRKICYLVSSIMKPISSHRDVSPKLKLQSPEASQVMDFVLKTRFGGRPIDRSEPTKFTVLKNLNSDLRLFQALDQLPASPMVNMICNPRKNNASLPQIDFKDICKPIMNLNSSQKKAVLSVANCCKLDHPVIHLIHGPPGCGKSEVITGIFQQIWSFSFRPNGKLPQILLCAPSNAAVDELVMRLDKIRLAMTKKKFAMVRVGRTDMVHKQAAMYTLERLIDVELKKARELEEDDELRNVEIKTLQAKVNQLTYQIENPGWKTNDSAYLSNIEKKLAETIKKKKDIESSKNKKLLEGKELREKKKELEQNILGNSNIIATTLSSCFIPEMAQMYASGKLNLTCCIVDEATQCTEPETLIPLMLGVTKLILVGDPQQLPATVFSQTAKDHGLDRSLFARHQECWKDMLEEDPKYRQLFESRCHFLNTQYRMHPDIMHFPSEHFYKGKVLTHPGLESRKLNCPLMPYVVLDHEFLQSKHEESNIKEAHLVINIVRSIVKGHRCEGMNIGIITPYNRQKELIKKELSSEEFSRLVEVGTVDSYQGRERDIILMSCVRTEGIGFMSGTERLNVALTRARHSLIICGNFVSLQRDSLWAALINNAKDRAAYKTYLHNSPNHDIYHKIYRPGF